MSARSEFAPISRATQGVGGNNNLGIIVVLHLRTKKTYIEKRVRVADIASGNIRREIRIMQQCRNHPNITTILTHDLNFHRTRFGSVYMQRSSPTKASSGRYCGTCALRSRSS
jgi:hypothetical protein